MKEQLELSIQRQEELENEVFHINAFKTSSTFLKYLMNFCFEQSMTLVYVDFKLIVKDILGMQAMKLFSLALSVLALS